MVYCIFYLKNYSNVTHVRIVKRSNVVCECCRTSFMLLNYLFERGLVSIIFEKPILINIKYSAEFIQYNPTDMRNSYTYSFICIIFK